MKLQSYFGCCSLSVGSLIIGLLNIILEVIAFILVSILTSKIQQLLNYFTSLQDDNTVAILQIGKSLYVGVLIYIIMMLAIAVLFIVGILMGKSLLLIPFVSAGFVNLLLAFAGEVAGLSLVCSIPFLTGGMIFLAFVIVIVSLCIQFYFWLVVFSFYQDLIAEKYGQLNTRSDIILQ